jgi:heavy metal sensor kinase
MTSIKRSMLPSSMRTRLTLWYTSVLALVLLLFAVSTYSYLARAARQRTDDSLSDTATSFVSSFDSELADENQVADDTAKEAAVAFRFRDRQVIIYDQRRNVIAASETPQTMALGNTWFESSAVRPQLMELISSANRSRRAYATLFSGENAIRILAIAVTNGPYPYSVVIANPLHDQEQALEQVRNAFYVAVPLALLIASLGGYFLARKSLRPVVTMGEEAAQIGASNLNARIPVPQNNNELGRLAVIFNDLLARLDQSFGQQRRFMADASHELRTPVAVICGESEVALSRPDRESGEYRESLAIVHDEGRRLTRMVEELFMLARADAGEYPLVLADFYLDESMSECVRSVRSLAAQKTLQIRYQPPEKEIAFRGDESLIRRMVLNLLHNAIKYTPENGQVSVSMKADRKQCEIVLKDTGHGIPEDAQPHIFDRFFRVDKARSREESLNGTGAGLGLSIAKWAAELHGGKIVLDHSDPGGTTFIIWLPIVR